MTTIGGTLVQAVETVWKEIQKRHPDVPDVVVTIQAKNGVYGHFAYNRWANESGKIDELFLNGEHISRGAVPTLGTLLHEAAHGVAKTRKIQDVSRMLQEALETCRIPEMQAPSITRATSTKITCQCGRILRGAPSTINKAPIFCGECFSQFQ